MFWWWEESSKYLCVQYIPVISNLKIPCLTYMNIKARTNECLPYLMNIFFMEKQKITGKWTRWLLKLFSAFWSYDIWENCDCVVKNGIHIPHKTRIKDRIQEAILESKKVIAKLISILITGYINWAFSDPSFKQIKRRNVIHEFKILESKVGCHLLYR